MKNKLKKFTAILLALSFLMVPQGLAKTKTKDEAPDKPRVKKHTGRHYRESRKYERRAKLKAEYGSKKKPKAKRKPTAPRQVRYPKNTETPEPEDPKVNGLVSLR